jgi:hypothetical protein
VASYSNVKRAFLPLVMVTGNVNALDDGILMAAFKDTVLSAPEAVNQNVIFAPSAGEVGTAIVVFPVKMQRIFL